MITLPRTAPLAYIEVTLLFYLALTAAAWLPSDFSIVFLTVNVCPLVPNDFQCENKYFRFCLIAPSLSPTSIHSLAVDKITVFPMRAKKE